MKETVEVYLHDTFGNELGDQIRRTFELFDLFELQGYEDDLENLIMVHDTLDPGQMQDSFMAIINKKIDYVLLNHTLELMPHQTLFLKNEIMYALWQLQEIDNYAVVDEILSSEMDSHEKIATLLQAYCSLSLGDILSVVEDINPAIFDRLQEMVDAKKELIIEPDIEMMQDRYDSLKTFIRRIHPDFMLIGEELIQKGFKAGFKFSHYAPFIKSVFQSSYTPSIEEKAIQLLSVFLLTPKEGENIANRLHGFETMLNIQLDEFDKLVNQMDRLYDQHLVNEA